MMGPSKEAQAALFYEFSLEDHVPQDNLLRSIDRFVDLGSIARSIARQSGVVGHANRRIVVSRSRDSHQPSSFCNGEAAGPVITDMGAFLGRGPER